MHSNLERMHAEPLSGYLLQGSNGEFVFLDPDECVEVVRAARDAISTKRLLIAGSGMESTLATIALTNRMEEEGADVALVVTPHYYKGAMMVAALENYYGQVADSPVLPIMLYNVPAFTGVELPVEVVMDLATHANIIGVKESTGDAGKIGLMVRETQEGDHGRAAEIRRRLIASNKAITTKFGVAGLKTALDMLGVVASAAPAGVRT